MGTGKLYYYSSKPRATPGQSTKASSKRSHSSGAKQSGIDCEGDNYPIVMGVEDASRDDDADLKEATLVPNEATATNSNPLRQSIARSSLREIPAEEVRRSGVSSCNSANFSRGSTV